MARSTGVFRPVPPLLLACVVAVTLAGCNYKPIKPVASTELRATATDVFPRAIKDATVAEISPSSEICRQLRGLRGWVDSEERQHCIVTLWISPFGAVRSNLHLRFNLREVPPTSFISSAKVYLYLLRKQAGVSGLDVYHAKYDEFLGYLRFQDLDTNAPYEFPVRFSGGWFEADVTKLVSTTLFRKQQDLGLTLFMDDAGITPKDGREAWFARSGMGSHVAPKLMVEYVSR